MKPRDVLSCGARGNGLAGHHVRDGREVTRKDRLAQDMESVVVFESAQDPTYAPRPGSDASFGPPAGDHRRGAVAGRELDALVMTRSPATGVWAR